MNEYTDSRKTVQDNMVVSLDYVLRVDGGIVDKTEENEPIMFLQGHGQIIPGLERQLYGMSIGESRTVLVSPEEGYGEEFSDAYAEVPREEFPPHIPLETGTALQLRDEQGEIVNAYIVEVRDESVRLNFNHPLAGKELQFQVTVTDLRQATEEEMVHGHVHGDDGLDEDDDEFTDAEEFDLELEYDEEEDWDEDDEDELDEDDLDEDESNGKY